MATRPSDNFAEVGERMQRRGRRVVAAAAERTDGFTDFLVERVQANTPVQSGRLQRSVHKEVVPTQGGQIVRDVVADAPYALEVHERPPELDHAHEGESTPEGFPGRQYLTRPLRFHRDEFAPAVRAGVGQALREDQG